MDIRLLGPLEVRDGDGVVSLPRRQQRALLAALALRAGEVVSTDRLVADLWGDHAPASAIGSLQNTVAGLRKLIGRDVLLTQPPGYRLAIPRDDVDAHRFEALVAEARDVEPAKRLELLRSALELWRGPALAELVEEEFARLEAPRLEELRIAAQEERLDAELALGRHATLVAELEQLVATHPLRERLRGQLMLALYRCGRQAEALEVYRAARLALADELGLDPTPELQELERRILRQDPDLNLPAEVADEHAYAREQPELRLVTVLAAAPPTADDPEQLRRLLDETLASVREVLDSYGGTLERFGPEGLVAFFGAEAPADDDAIRAVLAARELGLAAGVATGEVVQGAGAVVTRAVELARVGGIRLDQRTAALARAERRLDAPLVGRTEELERLRGALQVAREARRCNVVTVVGEPGIGKTRLAREIALREGAATTVLVARCLAHGDGATFLPLLGALRRAEPEQALAGEPDAELVLERLTALAEGGQGAPLGESYWAVRRLLEALARAQPVLLVLDDVHWAEPALVDLVDYLADRADAPVLVLCLARPELERPLGDRIGLGPLDENETRAVVAGTAALDEATSERIAELAEGNALYAEQLATFAAEGGEGLPPTLEAVLAGRLGRLDPSERAVLQRAAVIGREFTLGAVAALTGGEVARELLALSRGGFVHPAAAAEPGDDGYSFHHVLLRDAAYTGLTKADRGDLHERAAAWIDRDGPGDDATAGYHLEQAVRCRRELGEDADELAATAGERLGEAAMRVWRTNDVAAAAGLFERAIDLLPEVSLRAELLWESALALRASGRPGEASIRLERARVESAGNRALSARVSAEQARVMLAGGEIPLDLAAKAMSEAVRVLEDEGDERGLGRALLALFGVHLFGCNYTELALAAEQAAVHYVRAGFSPAACVGALAEALYFGPTPVTAAKERCAALVEAAPDRVTEANVTATLGALHALTGDFEEARMLARDAHQLFTDVGNSFGIATALAPLEIDIEIFAGDLAEAERLARSSLELLQAGGSPNRAYSTSRAVQLADLLLDAGQPNAVEPLLAFADADAVASDVYVQILRRSCRARLLVHAGDAEGAETLAQEAVAISAHTDGWHARARSHLALADAHALARRRADERRERRTAFRLFEAKGATSPAGSSQLRSAAPAR